MIFMSPISDIGFKKLFANNKRKNILISFLNSVLEREEGHKITEVEITDPNNNPEHSREKHSIVDIRCKDQSNKMYIIEMQVVEQEDFAQRTQYYTSRAIAQQLKKGDNYGKLVPVIFVGVVDFKLFQSPEYLSHHLIMNSKTHEQTLLQMEFHFLELSKFNKKVTELDGLVDKWIYLLKNACDFKQVPKELKKPAEIEEAMEALEQGMWTDAEIEAYEKYWDAVRNEASIYNTWHGKGKVEGIAEGKKEQAIVIALKLLAKGVDISEIEGLTDLTVDEIKKLK